MKHHRHATEGIRHPALVAARSPLAGCCVFSKYFNSFTPRPLTGSPRLFGRHQVIRCAHLAGREVIPTLVADATRYVRSRPATRSCDHLIRQCRQVRRYVTALRMVIRTRGEAERAQPLARDLGRRDRHLRLLVDLDVEDRPGLSMHGPAYVPHDAARRHAASAQAPATTTTPTEAIAT